MDFYEIAAELQEAFDGEYEFLLDDDHALAIEVAGQLVAIARWDDDDYGAMEVMFSPDCLPFEAAQIALALDGYGDVYINTSEMFAARKVTAKPKGGAN